MAGRDPLDGAQARRLTELGVYTFAELTAGLTPRERLREKLGRLLELRREVQGVYPRPLQEPLPVWVAVGGTPESACAAGIGFEQYGGEIQTDERGDLPASRAAHDRLLHGPGGERPLRAADVAGSHRLLISGP